MAKQQKPPVWRAAKGGDTWHPVEYSYAHLNGWRLEVHGSDKLWYFFASHKDGVSNFNSAWTEVRKAWLHEQGAKKAAERGAREGWAFLTTPK